MAARDLRVENLDFPKLEHRGKKLEHAVILKVVSAKKFVIDPHGMLAA